MTVAVLFCDPLGPYPKIPGTDCWDIKRDARLYLGPHPVVAHPPCQLWTNMAHVNFKRYGGEHNRPGNDGGCFASALAFVQKYHGVLEHPAFSHAWDKYNLPRPKYPGWNRGVRDWSCEVWQSAYGHQARKRTWLYYHGEYPPFELHWDRNPGTAQIGWFDRIKPTLSKRKASETPVEFALELVRLAEHAKKGRP